jgi:hypothetical protein
MGDAWPRQDEKRIQRHGHEPMRRARVPAAEKTCVKFFPPGKATAIRRRRRLLT